MEPFGRPAADDGIAAIIRNPRDRSKLRSLRANARELSFGRGVCVGHAACCVANSADRHLRSGSHREFSDKYVVAFFCGKMMNDDKDDDTARAEAARKGSPFLNTAQAAHYLRISIRTLEKLTEKGEGPPFRPHGRQKCFHIAEIEAWSEKHKRISSRRGRREKS